MEADPRDDHRVIPAFAPIGGGQDGGGASRSTEHAAGTSSATDVSLLDYIMSLFRENQRALDMAGEEREKAASALRAGTDDRIAALEKYLLAQLVAKANEFEAVHTADQTAITKSEEALTRRLDLLNEFRSQMADEAKKYAQREVVDAKFAAIDKQIDDVRKSIAGLGERLGKLT